MKARTLPQLRSHVEMLERLLEELREEERGLPTRGRLRPAWKKVVEEIKRVESDLLSERAELDLRQAEEDDPHFWEHFFSTAANAEPPAALHDLLFPDVTFQSVTVNPRNPRARDGAHRDRIRREHEARERRSRFRVIDGGRK